MFTKCYTYLSVLKSVKRSCVITQRQRTLYLLQHKSKIILLIYPFMTAISGAGVTLHVSLHLILPPSWPIALNQCGVIWGKGLCCSAPVSPLWCHLCASLPVAALRPSWQQQSRTSCPLCSWAPRRFGWFYEAARPSPRWFLCSPTRPQPMWLP